MILNQQIIHRRHIQYLHWYSIHETLYRDQSTYLELFSFKNSKNPHFKRVRTKIVSLPSPDWSILRIMNLCWPIKKREWNYPSEWRRASRLCFESLFAPFSRIHTVDGSHNLSNICDSFISNSGTFLNNNSRCSISSDTNCSQTPLINCLESIFDLIQATFWWENCDISVKTGWATTWHSK